MLLGCHLSIGKGFSQALVDAESLGINATQIFSHNASSWRMKPVDDEAAAEFRSRFASSKVEYVVIHTMYLLNLATPDNDLFERSVSSLTEEVRRAGLLGINHIVTHLGAHKDAGIEAGIERIITALNRVVTSDEFARYPNIRLLLENTAGAGTTMGTTFAELGRILAGLDVAGRIGICLDTCHAFAAGYELRTDDAIADTLVEFDREVGIGHLELVHLNDSKFPLGSRHDRHENIGHGDIGVEGISRVVNHPSLRDMPFILETPKVIDGHADADQINLQQVRSLRHE